MVSNPRPAAPADTGPTIGCAVWFHSVAAVARRPDLWRTAVRQWSRLVPEHWWRRSPRLPVPPRAYLRFRLETAYGPGTRARAADIVEYLEWCRHANPPKRVSARR